jgi:hypothetical protein
MASVTLLLLLLLLTGNPALMIRCGSCELTCRKQI